MIRTYHQAKRIILLSLGAFILTVIALKECSLRTNYVDAQAVIESVETVAPTRVAAA